jgi:CheY-like chemotaxis protein
VDTYVAHAAHIRRLWEQETRPHLLPHRLLPSFDIVQDGLEALALLQAQGNYDLVLLSSALRDVTAQELAHALAHRLKLPASLVYVTAPGAALDEEEVRC